MDDIPIGKTPYCPRDGVRLDEVYVRPQRVSGRTMRPLDVLVGYQCPGDRKNPAHSLNIGERPDWA